MRAPAFATLVSAAQCLAAFSKVAFGVHRFVDGRRGSLNLTMIAPPCIQPASRLLWLGHNNPCGRSRLWSIKLHPMVFYGNRPFLAGKKITQTCREEARQEMQYVPLDWSGSDLLKDATNKASFLITLSLSLPSQPQDVSVASAWLECRTNCI